MTGRKLPTGEEVAWQLAHHEDSIGDALIATCAVCAPLATIFVVLRIWSRRLLHGHFRLNASDWLCIAAWPFFIGNEVLVANTTRFGCGRHTVFVTDPRTLQILSIVIENLYAVVLALLKLSVLSLYRTIFGKSIWFSRAIWPVGFLVCCLSAGVILASDLQCVPIQATWDTTIQQATCIDYGRYGLAANIVNIITDLIIVSMPLPLVWSLKIPTQKKRMLMIIFATGGSACIVSIVQLRYITKLGSTSDPSWDNAPIFVTTSVECMIGFLAVSVAAYGPLYQFLRGQKVSVTKAPYYIHDNEQIPNKKYSYSAQVSVDKRFCATCSFFNLRTGIMATDEIHLVRYADCDDGWTRVSDHQDGSVS